MITIEIGKKNNSKIYANWNSMGDGFVWLGHLTGWDLTHMTPDFKILCDAAVYPGTVSEMYKNMCDEAYEEYMK